MAREESPVEVSISLSAMISGTLLVAIVFLLHRDNSSSILLLVSVTNLLSSCPLIYFHSFLIIFVIDSLY